ncbi:Gram-negative bacterial tonB protein [Xenococcus sp. PCC 7305]|uniref:energy transducer TonB n=1 Tax=Xenococcus sp. PCC 7305 TaxID=102125 RepID=UPI0002ACD345|nr:energy transducer TonB [Xenococcus sp. PCC 7305]ELS04908.1 Gram-negative bacterial tonB protein [Xenococcus sp. PCC 7305]
MSSELNLKINHQESAKKPIISSTHIALLVSLGLHLLLYKYGFPALFVQTQNVSGRQTVETIELNPFEQARLPDLESNFAIPEFNNTPLDGTVPPLALPTYLNPEIGDLTDLPAIPVPLLPNFDDFPAYSSDIALPPIGELSDLPVPPTLEDLDSLVESPVTAVEDLPEEPELLPEEPETAIATKTPVEEPEEPEAEKPTPEEIAAVRQQKLQGDLSEVSNSLQKQNLGNSDDDARKNYVAWISRIEEIKPEEITFEGVYPKDACIRRLEGASVYGVVVDSSNQIVDAELLKSATYPVFNQQAIKDLEKYDFGNETQDTKPYQVTVDYKYNAEICPSLTLPSLRKENDATATPETETPETVPVEPESAVPEIETPTEAESTETETVAPQEAETLDSETSPEEEDLQPEDLSPDDSLRERLRNNPLPDDDSLRERLQNTTLPDNDAIRERLRKTPLPEN